MNELENKLLHEEAAGARPRLCVRSKTRIDTGLWWSRSRVWLCVMADELIMLAVARRRYSARIALGECRASTYCPATGELVIEPGEALAYSRFAVSPREALQILKFLNTEY